MAGRPGIDGREAAPDFPIEGRVDLVAVAGGRVPRTAALDVPGRADVLRPGAVVLVAGVRLGRDLAVAVVPALPVASLLPATGGVPVREVEALVGLEVPFVPSCLVGDLMGDLKPLASRGAGVGLPSIALDRLPGPVCVVSVCRRAPVTAAWILLGRPPPLFSAPLAAGLADGFVLGSSMTQLTPLGRQKMPYGAVQSKYRLPWTDPSFFPDGSSSTTPTHCPSANAVVPTKRTVPNRPSFNSTFWPTDHGLAPLLILPVFLGKSPAHSWNSNFCYS